MSKKVEKLFIENAVIAFRNFSGKEGMYNRDGARNFVVFLDPEMAAELATIGWNVKYLKPREEGDEPQAYLPVAVNFNGPRPPMIVLITSRGRTNLNEDEVNILDWAEIAFVDLVINPYQWEINGPEGLKSGIKAYLQSMYVTLEENPIEMKYADIPDSALNTLPISDEAPF